MGRQSNDVIEEHASQHTWFQLLEPPGVLWTHVKPGELLNGLPGRTGYCLRCGVVMCLACFLHVFLCEEVLHTLTLANDLGGAKEPQMLQLPTTLRTRKSPKSLASG